MARKLLDACEAQGIPAVKVAFGDELKREVMELYGIDKHMVGGREVLIRHGQERRAQDEYYWLRPVEKLRRLAQVSGVLCILDDLRFPSEFEWAGRVGMLTVRMVASPQWREAMLLKQGLCTDVVYTDSDTETSLDGFRFQHAVRNFAGAQLDARAVQLLAHAV